MATKKTLAKVEEPQIDLTSIQTKSEAMAKMVDETTVANDKDLTSLAEKIKNIKLLGAYIKAEKEKLTKPAQAIINEARLKYLPYEKMCSEAEGKLKVKASLYMTKVEADRLAQEAKIAKRVDTGNIKEETGIRKLEELGDEEKTVRTENVELQKKMVKTVIIKDRELIPHEYWVVDEVAVRRASLAGAKIPGVEVKEVAQISIK